MRAQIVTPWIGSGTSTDPYRPQIADDYSIDWDDATGQSSDQIPPSINAYTIEATLDQKTLETIKGDDRFIVLWDGDDEPEDEPGSGDSLIDSNRFVKLSPKDSDTLSQQLATAGYIDIQLDNLTRVELSAELIARQRLEQKATTIKKGDTLVDFGNLEAPMDHPQV